MVTVALLALSAASPAIQATPPRDPSQIVGERSVVSKCGISDDPTYGYTADNPIRVGGTPLFGAARQRQYLNALAGPAGQPVRYRRRGALPPDPARNGLIIDHYDVAWDGLETPIELYLDLYNWEEPRAPRGLLCAAAIGLLPMADARPGELLPPPGGAPAIMPPAPLGWAELAPLAIDEGLREELPVIPMHPSRTLEFGILLDPFTRMARAARAIAARGATPVPEMLSDISTTETLMVAYPRACEDGRAAPTAIRVTRGERLVAAAGEPLSGRALAAALPGVPVPEHALGLRVRATALMNVRIEITYDRPCGAEGASVSVAPEVTIAGEVTRDRVDWPDLPVPADARLVVVRYFIDRHGVPYDVKAEAGPDGFRAPAEDAVRRSRHGVPVINGVPLRSPRPGLVSYPLPRR